MWVSHLTQTIATGGNVSAYQLAPGVIKRKERIKGRNVKSKNKEEGWKPKSTGAAKIK